MCVAYGTENSAGKQARFVEDTIPRQGPEWRISINFPYPVAVIVSATQKSASNFGMSTMQESQTKCDGLHPTCSNYRYSYSEYRYVILRPLCKAEQSLYIRALEERVTELESSFRANGCQGTAEVHWERSMPSERTQTRCRPWFMTSLYTHPVSALEALRICLWVAG